MTGVDEGAEDAANLGEPRARGVLVRAPEHEGVSPGGRRERGGGGAAEQADAKRRGRLGDDEPERPAHRGALQGLQGIDVEVLPETDDDLRLGATHAIERRKLRHARCQVGV